MSRSLLGERVTDTLPELIAKRWQESNCRVSEPYVFQMIVVRTLLDGDPFLGVQFSAPAQVLEQYVSRMLYELLKFESHTNLSDEIPEMLRFRKKDRNTFGAIIITPLADSVEQGQRVMVYEKKIGVPVY